MFNQYSKAKCYLFDRTDTNAHSYVRHAKCPSALFWTGSAIKAFLFSSDNIHSFTVYSFLPLNCSVIV